MMFKVFSALSHLHEGLDLENQLNKFLSNGEKFNVEVVYLTQSSGNSYPMYTTTVTIAYRYVSVLVPSVRSGIRARVLKGTRAEMEEKLSKLGNVEVCHMAQSEYHNEPESIVVVTMIY